MAMRPDNDDSGAARGTPEAIADAVTAAITLADGAPATMPLRLDAHRHLRLRIACALGRRSAQAILIDALDAHLKTIDGVERLAAAAESGDAATGWGTDR